MHNEVVFLVGTESRFAKILGSSDEFDVRTWSRCAQLPHSKKKKASTMKPNTFRD